MSGLKGDYAKNLSQGIQIIDIIESSIQAE
jgi:hypothetical protein